MDASCEPAGRFSFPADRNAIQRPDDRWILRRGRGMPSTWPGALNSEKPGPERERRTRELQLCLAQSVYKNKLQRQRERERRFGSRVKSRLDQLMNDTTRAPASFGPSLVFMYKIKSPHSPGRAPAVPLTAAVYLREKNQARPPV